MKTINYTGSSKLISRIVNLLNRRAPLPLDGDGDPDWGTNGQVLSTDGSGNTAWINAGGGGDSVSWTQDVTTGTKIAEIDINGNTTDVYAPSAGSGGHTIWNRIKSALTARSNLWFADASTSDVSADDATKVEVVTELLNETAFDNLATDGTADGIYTFPDSGGEYLTADMSSYDNTASGLLATDVQDAIDEIVQISDATKTENGFTFEFHRQGNIACVVLISGSASTSLAANATICNIPNGFKPYADGFQTTIAYGGTGRVGIWKWTGGTITIQDAMSSGATPRFSIMYFCE